MSPSLHSSADESIASEEDAEVRILLAVLKTGVFFFSQRVGCLSGDTELGSVSFFSPMAEVFVNYLFVCLVRAVVRKIRVRERLGVQWPLG